MGTEAPLTPVSAVALSPVDVPLVVALYQRVLPLELSATKSPMRYELPSAYSSKAGRQLVNPSADGVLPPAVMSLIALYILLSVLSRMSSPARYVVPESQVNWVLAM